MKVMNKYAVSNANVCVYYMYIFLHVRTLGSLLIVGRPDMCAFIEVVLSVFCALIDWDGQLSDMLCTSMRYVHTVNRTEVRR